jgi:multidrug transporter EmrE-like cation transporter
VGAAVSNVAVALLLLPLGVVLFREQLTAANVVGIVFCLTGLVLIVR